jgi:hypothetical protein
MVYTLPCPGETPMRSTKVRRGPRGASSAPRLVRLQPRGGATDPALFQRLDVEGAVEAPSDLPGRHVSLRGVGAHQD